MQMIKAKLFTLNYVFRAVLKSSYKRFMCLLEGPAEYQAGYLMGLINRNRETSYGKKYSFGNIRSVDEYRKSVPIVIYDDICGYIERIKEGESNVLTRSPVIMFEKTSGSVSATKYIPFTAELLSEINSATSAWMYDIYRKRSSLIRGTAYWSVSPKFGSNEVTKAGLRVGMDDDSQYFSRVERFFLKHLFAVKPEVSVLEIDNFRFETSLQLLSDENLGFISVWNPTFLILLLDYIENNKSELLTELKRRYEHGNISLRRITKLEMLLNNGGKVNYINVWPGLSLVSCWCEGTSAVFVEQLMQMLPGVEIQGKGVLMTEGIVTIPLFGFKAPVLSVGSHFYEFMLANESTGNETFLPGELKIAEEYIPVITTGGGLYRYNTNDIVRVEGFYKNVPLLSFVGRVNKVADICGEKLNEGFVSKVLAELNSKFSLKSSFQMLAPVISKHPHYALFIETSSHIEEPIEVEQYLDKLLCRNHNYKNCRVLNQLCSVKMHRVEDALETYERELVKNKMMKPGDVKNSVLDSGILWAEKFKYFDSPGKLKSRIISLEKLTQEVREILFNLYSKYFDNVTIEKFSCDIEKKDDIIVLSDKNPDKIIGFSTLKVLEATVDGIRIKAIFNGDTIIDQKYWGSQELVRAVTYYSGTVAATMPNAKAYWFLISKGYKTYLYLSLFMKSYYPNYMSEFPRWEKAMLDTLAMKIYPDEYDPQTCLIRFKESTGSLKPGVADVTKGRLKNPQIKFFAEKNPDHANGTELACIGELSLLNLKSVAKTYFEKGLKA